MPQIVAALYEDSRAARQALEALIAAGLGADRIALISDPQGRSVPSMGATAGMPARDDALAALDDLPLPDEDVALFRSGVAQGGVLVTARVDRADFDRAIEILEMFEPVDIDGRTGGATRGERAGADVGAPLAAGLTGGLAAPGQTNTAALPGAGELTDELDDVGSDDLRTGEGTGPGTDAPSTVPTGGRRAEERAEQPGVLAMDARADAARAAKMAPALGAETSGRGNAQPDLYRRETNRSGRVRAYSRDV